jgi:hypothetical protein
MEHTRLAAVIPLDASWTDVGRSPPTPTLTLTPALTLTLTLTLILTLTPSLTLTLALTLTLTLTLTPDQVGSWPSLFQTCVEKPSNSASNRLNRVFEKGEVRSLDLKRARARARARTLALALALPLALPLPLPLTRCARLTSRTAT